LTKLYHSKVFKLQEFSRVFSLQVGLLNSLLTRILDLIFPKSETELKMERLQADFVIKNCKPSKKIDSMENAVAINAILSYKDPLVRQIIWQMKFGGQKFLANLCGEIIFREFFEKSLNKITDPDQNYILLPIPIHKRRLRERGFNQCESICETIARHGKTVQILYKPKILKRKIYTEKQSWGDRRDRFSKISGVFETDKSELNQLLIFLQHNPKSSVVIIDDVITTGATTKEAAKVLIDGGIPSHQIIILAFAH
jgi:ComF family protein